MASVEDLEMLASLEDEYGVEATGGGLSGVYAGRISAESEIRTSKATGSPRLMVKVEVTHPEESTGRKTADFYGWFGQTDESTKVVRNILYSTIRDIAASSDTIDVSAVVSAFRMLPSGNGETFYDEAHQALMGIRDALVGNDVFIRVVQREDNNSRTYFLAPDHKDVVALLDPTTV